MGRPILGALKSRFVFLYVLVDSLLAGVRKTQEDILKVFILSNDSACKTNKYKGEIEWNKHNIYLYIRVVTKYLTLFTITTVLHLDQCHSPATRNAKIQYFNQIYILRLECLC